MNRVTFSIFFQANQPASNPDNLSLLGWLAGFLVAAAVVTLVVWPLLNVKTWVRRNPAGQTGLELDTLYNRLETEQLALDELEFDQEAGGLAETDYLQLKSNSQNVIQELEQEIKGREQDLGEYERRREARIAENHARSRVGTATVSAKVSQPIAVVEKELPRRSVSRKELHCSECATPFKPGDRFCVNCGAPLPVVCQSCGAELSPDDRFCAKCGATIRR